MAYKEYNKQYYENNKEKLKKYQKQYYQANKEKIKQRQKQYYQKHKEKRKEYLKQYQAKHKEKYKEYGKRYYKNHKEQRKHNLEQFKEKNKEYFKQYHKKHINAYRYYIRLFSWKKHNINITWQQYAMLWLKQNRKCAICGKPIKLFSNSSNDTAQVDHDHNTGKIRGLLCYNCNLIIGNIEKIPDLNPYIKYLEGYK